MLNKGIEKLHVGHEFGILADSCPLIFLSFAVIGPFSNNR